MDLPEENLTGSFRKDGVLIVHLSRNYLSDEVGFQAWGAWGTLAVIREEVGKKHPSVSSSSHAKNSHSESSLHSTLYVFRFYCQEPRKQTKREVEIQRPMHVTVKNSES